MLTFYFLLAQVISRSPNGERAVMTPTTCTAGQFVSAISTSAVGTCSTPASGSGDLLAANNLSDVANTATARANLGAEPAGTFSGIGN